MNSISQDRRSMTGGRPGARASFGRVVVTRATREAGRRVRGRVRASLQWSRNTE